MEPPSDPARQAPAVRRLADWLDRQWSALGELGRTAVVLGSLAAVSLGVLAAWTDWVKDIRGTPLLVAAAMPEKATGVAAAAWLDPRGEGPEVRLWVLFRNDSDKEVLDLRYLKLDTPGFRWVACMAGGGPDCRPQGHGKRPVEGLPAALGPGESRAVFGRLEPTGRASHGVSGIFGWRDQAGEHAGLLVVPEAPADRGWQRALDFVGRLVLFVRDLVKDLAWPIVLALLAWYLKRRDDRREKAEKDAEREREARETSDKEQQEGKERRQREEREERERLQIRFQQTWNLMLPKSHRNAERHYMPVLSGIDEVRRSLSLEREGKAEPGRLLWAVLRLFRSLRALVRSIGGFYLRDLEAERLVSLCWTRFFQRAEEILHRRELEVALDALALQETLDSFLRRMEASEAAPAGPNVPLALKTLNERLQAWETAGLEGALSFLDVLSAVLSYEVNRTYELWYRSPATFDAEGFGAALEALRRQSAASPDPGLERLVGDLEIYPARITAHQDAVKKRLEGAADGI